MGLSCACAPAQSAGERSQVASGAIARGADDLGLRPAVTMRVLRPECPFDARTDSSCASQARRDGSMSDVDATVPAVPESAALNSDAGVAPAATAGVYATAVRAPESVLRNCR